MRKHKTSIFIAGDSRPFLVELSAQTLKARIDAAKASDDMVELLPEERTREDRAAGQLYIDPYSVSALSEFFPEGETNESS